VPKGNLLPLRAVGWLCASGMRKEVIM
jgi:hypothetical protein